MWAVIPVIILDLILGLAPGHDNPFFDNALLGVKSVRR